MASSLIERQLENVVQGMVDEKGLAFLKGVSKMAAKQGGGSALENYQLLGKRTLIAAGAALIVVQAAASAIGFVISRRSEEQRIERIVRRVLEEERQ